MKATDFDEAFDAGEDVGELAGADLASTPGAVAELGQAAGHGPGAYARWCAVRASTAGSSDSPTTPTTLAGPAGRVTPSTTRPS